MNDKSPHRSKADFPTPSSAAQPDSRETSAPAATTTSRQPRRRWLRWVLMPLYLLVLAEIACRGYWSIRFGVPFFDMRQIVVGRFYPELRTCGALTADIRHDDETLDVLILGGSVVTSIFGPIDQLLEQHLEETTGRPVRVFNCANVAQTSLDSVHKYELLDQQRFDLVLVYESMNEARLNNWPRERFLANYEHASWYRRIGALQRHAELNWTVLPYSLEYLVVGWLDHPRLGYFLPRHGPPNHVWPGNHGLDVKTAPCYRHNLERIIALAHQRGAMLVLPQYAYHIPDQTAQQRYAHAGVGNWDLGSTIPTWGTPEGVAKAIDAHNEIIRQLAAEHDDVLTVDLHRLFPQEGFVFNDPCHLTRYGCELFVQHLRQPLAGWTERMARQAPDHRGSPATTASETASGSRTLRQ